MNEKTQAETKAKIAQLRASYGKLRMTCGLNRISRETIAEYANAVKTLEAQLVVN